jgi:hypothetical protein
MKGLVGALRAWLMLAALSVSLLSGASAYAAPSPQVPPPSFIRGPDLSTPWFAPTGLKLTNQVGPTHTVSGGRSCTFEDGGDRYVITMSDPLADSRTTRLQYRATVTKPPLPPEPGKEATIILETSGSVLQQGPNDPPRLGGLNVSFGAASNMGRESTVSGSAYGGAQWGGGDASVYVQPVRPARNTDPRDLQRAQHPLHLRLP